MAKKKTHAEVLTSPINSAENRHFCKKCIFPMTISEEASTSNTWLNN